MTVAIPNSVFEITPAWLTDALRAGAAVSKAGVRSIGVQVIGEGVGFLGQLARLSIEYDAPEAGAPASVIAKLPSPNPEARALANLFRFYECESLFYQQVADKVRLRTPRLYFSVVDTQSGDAVLLLEDLAPARPGDQVAACSLAEAKLAISSIAVVHADWWESERFQGLAWLPATDDPVRAALVEGGYEQAWQPFVDNLGHKVPAELMAVCEKLKGRVGGLLKRLGQPPVTLVHGDYRLDNMFFGDGAGGVQFAAIDWQIVGRGRGVFDIGYFMGDNLEVDVRRAHEDELLRLYFDVLTKNGVTGYSFEQCKADYKLSIAFALMYLVITGGSLDVSSPRAQELADAAIRRYSAVIADHDLSSIIDG